MALIEIRKKGRDKVRSHTVRTEAVSIGRSSSCVLTLHDIAVSRQHCIIERNGDGYRVRDLGSSHGLRVDGKRAREAPIGDGTTIRVGPYTLTVVAPDWGDPVASDPCDGTAAPHADDSALGLVAPASPDPALIAENTKLRVALEAAQAELETAKQERDERTAALEAVSAARDAAAEDVNAARETQAATQDALDAAQAEVKRYASELEELRTERETVVSDRDDVAARCEEIQRRLDEAERAATEERESLTTLIARLGEDRDASERKLADAVADRGASEERMTALAAEHAALQTQLEELHTQSEAGDGASRLEVEKLRESVAARRAERDLVHEALETERMRGEHLTDEIVSLRGQLEDAQADAGEAVVDDSAAARLADVEAERDRLREEIASIEDTARAVAEGEAERDALRAEVAELEGMLEEALDGKVPVAAAETGDDEAVATLTRERDEARGVSKDLTDKIRHMMLEQSQLQSRAEQAERGRDEMQRRVDVARREKAAAMDRIKEVMGRLAEADRRVVGLQTRLRNDTRRLVGYIQQLRAASGMEVQEVELSSEDIARLQAAGVEVIELDG